MSIPIRGNRDGYGVRFAHKFHSDSNKIQCYDCHHFNKPNDKNTECFECHNSMYAESDVFNHDWHSSKVGANIECFKCHSKKQSKGMDFRGQPEKIASACLNCHKDFFPDAIKEKKFNSYKTLSYTDAMHQSCIACHQERLRTDADLKLRKPNLSKCSTCHTTEKFAQNNIELYNRKEFNKFLVIPNVDDK